MNKEKLKKYRPYPPVRLKDRTWPDRVIDRAPVWCSVDLRDGNQALIQPMNLEEKLEMFRLLVEVGFKEIEVGFPSASQVEFDFLRLLIEGGHIPDGVLMQVLTQAREQLIRKTFASIRGAREAVVHLYNSTSTLQRDVVFKMDRREIIALGVKGARLIREQARDSDVRVRYEYSPESFTGTELDFALEICEAVMEVWEPTPANPVIINLPATVEMSTPNIYADQIEWFCRHMKNRDCAIISVHAHNDRGEAVAATELALMAGADRVEGTLFGNGERTGNVDIVTLALNMFTQGVDPNLDLSRINRVINVYERCTKMKVHPRHPYAGELVYTAFSGSHQDAINKGMSAVELTESGLWNVPYLPIDPQDLGRTYESIIRVNSQSGKGGIAYLMETENGIVMPRRLQVEFSGVVQRHAERLGGEVSADDIWDLFAQTYLEPAAPIRYREHHLYEHGSVQGIRLGVDIEGTPHILTGEGNGPINAAVHAFQSAGIRVQVRSYEERSMGKGGDAKACSFVEVTQNGSERECYGVGMDANIVTASIRALLSGANRLTANGKK